MDTVILEKWLLDTLEVRFLINCVTYVFDEDFMILENFTYLGH